MSEQGRAAADEAPAPEEVLGFNPFDPSFRIDPYSVYRRLREAEPVHRTPFGLSVLSRYAECEAILHDARASSDARNSSQYRQAVASLPDEQRRQLEEQAGRQSFLFMDAPDHTRLRGLVSKAFTPRVVEGLRPRVQSIVDELLEPAAENGSMDAIEELAYPLPVTVICEMLGVPTSDQAMFRAWSREIARALDPEMAIPPDVLERRQRTVQDFRAYFERLIGERRARPRADLLSALIAAEEQGDKLTGEELLTTCVLLLIAGHETTVNLIGNGVLALLRHPDQLATLRDRPELVRGAVEEVLRYDAPVQMTMRVVREDMQVAGTVLPEGEQAVVLLGSANRDPRQFPDAERFDITRERNAHIAFSAGPHFCLGAALARLEAQVALDTLARRFARLELATDEPVYKENIVLRGLQALPVCVA